VPFLCPSSTKLWSLVASTRSDLKISSMLTHEAHLPKHIVVTWLVVLHYAMWWFWSPCDHGWWRCCISPWATSAPFSVQKVFSAQTSEAQLPTLNVLGIFCCFRVTTVHFLLALLSFLTPSMETNCILRDVNTLRMSLFLSHDLLYHFVITR